MTELTKREPREIFAETVERYATSFLSEIAEPDQLTRAKGLLALSLRKTGAANPQVYQCSPASVAHCVAMSALADLLPGGVKPDVYLIPRKGQLEWQISARGLAKLAERAGWRSIVAHPVHRDDPYEVELGTDERIRWTPTKHPESLAECKAFMVVGQYHRDGAAFRVVTSVPIEVIEKRRKLAQSQNVWSQWPIEMAQKTAVSYAISRGYFGSLESTPAMRAVRYSETQQAEYDQPRRPALPRESSYSVTAEDISIELPEVPHE
jgi:recombinational DNA repair protein RecT